MFKKMIYFFDTEGKPQNKMVQSDIVRCDSFGLESRADFTLKEGRFPNLFIVRKNQDTEKSVNDPYKNNDNDRVSSTWSIIINPHVIFFASMIEVVGLEIPGLCWAGLILPAYKGCKPLDIPEDMVWNQDTRPRPRDIGEMKFQKILLL